MDELDRLNLIWRIVSSGHRRLIEPHQLADVARLADDAGNQSDFADRLSTVANILKAIRIDDDELPPGELARLQEGGQNQPLHRLESVLSESLEPPELADARQAISTLRAVNGVRNSLQHPESRSRYRAQWTRLGLPLFPADWTDAWRTTRSHLAGALRQLRRSLESLESSI